MVKWCPRDPKIGMQSCFGSNSMVEFDSKIPPNFACPTIHAAANFCHVTLASLDAWWPNSWEMWPEASNSTVLSGLGRVSMGFWQNIEKHAVKHRPSDQKLGIHSDFGPISRVDFKNWDPKYFGQPYCSYAIPRFAPDFRFQRRIGLTSWPRAHFNQLLAISGPWFGKTTLGQFWCWIGLYWFLHFYNQVKYHCIV